MVADDLGELLRKLYQAGASRVPAEDVGWDEEDAPALNRAINMQYIVYRDTTSGRQFSLTESGYRAIEQEPPDYLPMSRKFRAFFNLKFFLDP